MAVTIDLLGGDNTLLVKVTGLKNATDDTVINDATVSVTITDDAGDEVGGVTWPVSLDSDGAGGNYTGTIDEGLSLVAGDYYSVTLNVASGSNRAEIKQTVKARNRAA